MSIDLIKRATERMKAGQAAPAPTSSPHQAPAAPIPATPAAPLPVTASPAAAPAPSITPSSSIPLATPASLGDHSPLLTTAPSGPRSSKTVKLDMDRLHRLGVITPNTPETTQIAEEFRIIKRPLLLKAF